MGARLPERSVWQATKAVYSSLIAQSIRWEIAESFFNSLTRRVFATEGVDQAIEFVDTDFDVPPSEHDGELCRRYSRSTVAGFARGRTDGCGWSGLCAGVLVQSRPRGGRRSRAHFRGN